MSSVPVLRMGTSEVTSGHRAGETPSREEHSTLQVPEQRTWALSLKHSAPAPLVLLHLQPILQLGLMMVMLSVTVAGPCRLGWIGADDVTAWGSNFTQSDFTPQQFLKAVFSIAVDKIRSSLITQCSREGLQKREGANSLESKPHFRTATQGLEVAYRGRQWLH